MPVRPNASQSGQAKSIFGELSGIKDFWQLKEICGLDMNACQKAVWEEAWAGRISCTSWEPVRKSLAAKGGAPLDSDVRPTIEIPGRRRIPRALRERWKQGSPVAGNWFSLAADEGFYDSLDEEELDRERVRLLLRRWGVLCRPLLEREAPALGWGRLLPAMRRMELGGELVAGQFFEGIASLQFASPSIEAELEEAAAETRVFWLNACDPASPSGLEAQGPGNPGLPARLASNRLCFRGADLVAVSCRGGKELRLNIQPDDAALGEILAGFIASKTFARPGLARQKIIVETINGRAAAKSPYAAALKALGFKLEWNKFILW